jgi:hypothetical protein
MKRTQTLLVLCALVLGTGCLTTLDGEYAAGSVVQSGEFSFAFSEFEPKHYDDLPRIDAAGVPLVATSIIERDRGDEHHAPNSYTNSAPRSALSTIRVLKGAARLTRMWGDDFARLPHHDGSGQPYAGCQCPLASEEPNEQNLPCQFQRVFWRDALYVTKPSAGRTADAQLAEDEAMDRPYALGDEIASRLAPSITAPERLLIKFDEPAGFPNGRLPWEQINDKVFAFGFLPLETNGRDGAPMTLDQLHMNPYRNDVAFPVQADGRGAFPYLAPPHGTVYGGAYPYPAAGQ